jgi:para-aminobenzoate synthetase component I
MNTEDIGRSFGSITKIYSQDIALDEPFTDFAGRFAHIPGTVVLLSGGDMDCSRFHILGTRPWLWLKSRHDHVILENGQTRLEAHGDPFNTLKDVIASFNMTDWADKDIPPGFPIAAGLLGYLSYDLKDCIEDLPRTSVDRMGLPHLLLTAPSILVVQDKRDRRTRLFIVNRDINGRKTLDGDLDFFNDTMEKPSLPVKEFKAEAACLTSNFTKENYLLAVSRIKEYIASGHVYQVNLSQRFEADFCGDPYWLFTHYFKLNPAPFFAYINAGDHHVVSTSPERFVQQIQNRVEARPIKGTRPRGNIPEADLQLRKELFQSKKDDAELSMIVDLMRNDIGKVCSSGSVCVSEHKRVEAYQNVWHLVSVINGNLDQGCDSVDLIRAIFPGGSITGCPKIRSMEIIDELEPDRRHIYTGSIGYISFHDTMDLSIAIRTATIHQNKIVFSVGGGIVFDSDPEDEFEETLHKGRTLMSAFEKRDPGEENRLWAWINGAIVPADEAQVPLTGLGFQYGYGFFETIRVDKAIPKSLSAHIQRFNQTWQYLFEGPVPDITWDKVIAQVVERNRLEHKTAAVKLIAARGTRDIRPYDYTLSVLARPYVHRLENKEQAGITLITYPCPRQTPLADFKTLNYLYYYRAGKWAAGQGADEALILNPDNSLSETHTANLLLIRDKTVVLPVSPHVLPGTMQQAVCKVLRQWGYAIEEKVVFPDDLFSHDEVWITNALIGAVPVLTLDGKKLNPPSPLWKKINQAVL